MYSRAELADGRVVAEPAPLRCWVPDRGLHANSSTSPPRPVEAAGWCVPAATYDKPVGHSRTVRVGLYVAVVRKSRTTGLAWVRNSSK